MKTKKFKNIVPKDSRELTPVKIIASDLEGINTPYVKASYVDEPGSFNA